MPTKHRRHAITETPRVKEALDPLRGELDDQRIDFSELVVLGAEVKLEALRRGREDRAAKIERLAEKVRRQELDGDPDLADEAKRSWVRD